MVSDWVKRWMIAGIGMAVLTKEKVEELVQELVRSGEFDGEESKQVARSILKQAEEQRDELAKLVDRQVKRVLASAGVVLKEEYEALEARVRELEARLVRLEGSGAPGDAGGEGEPEGAVTGRDAGAPGESDPRANG